jgi:SAM-dependent methyltransferase
MVFSEEWDLRYRQNTHLSVWPWSDVVSLFHRHCKPIDVRTRVLELGCGAGANIPFFLSLGVQYYAIEGSSSMVARLQQRFPEVGGRIMAGDFTRELPFDADFDVVVDRASLTHNGSESIASALALVGERLKPGGHFIGVDWFSTTHSEFQRGAPSGDDPYTRMNFESGPFAETGRVHFSDEAHLRALFAQFDLIFLEEKLSRHRIPAATEQFGAWNIVARKSNV